MNDIQKKYREAQREFDIADQKHRKLCQKINYNHKPIEEIIGLEMEAEEKSGSFKARENLRQAEDELQEWGKTFLKMWDPDKFKKIEPLFNKKITSVTLRIRFLGMLARL